VGAAVTGAGGGGQVGDAAASRRGSPACARAQPARFGQEEQPGPAAGRRGADVLRKGGAVRGGRGAPPTGLWGARLVGEAGLRAPAAGLHAGAA
jgi:hypothetical protein